MFHHGDTEPPSRGMGKSSLISLCVSVSLCLSTGCGTPPPAELDDPPPVRVQDEAPLPSYAEVVAGYNARVAGLSTLWSRAELDMRWVTGEGKNRSEQGAGKFIFQAPSNTALTLGKLGSTSLWAGSNDTWYWLFDLQEQQKLWAGRHANVGRPCSEPLPMPFQPEALPFLLGLVAIEPDPAPREPAVERTEDGYLVIEPPRLRLRFMVHPQTYHPVRIDVIDRDGYSVVSARLERFEPVPTVGAAEADWPLVPTQVYLFPVDRAASMEIALSGLSDGDPPSPGAQPAKIKPQLFDLDVLRKLMDPREVAVLDAGC